MESYTTHLLQPAQKNQKKEDASDTISKSFFKRLDVSLGVDGFRVLGFWVFAKYEFNYFLTSPSKTGINTFHHEQN